MSDEGQEHADAEHRKRLLAADDQGIENPPLQARPVLRHEADDQDDDDDEVQEAIGRQIGLVVRIERRIQPVREQVAESRKLAGHGHDQREDHVGDAEPERGRVHDHRRRLPCTTERAPCAEYEQHLPGERVEVPGAGRVGRQIPSRLPRHQPKHDGGQHSPVGLAQHDPQHRREQAHQHDVERQHVEIDGLELQEQSLPQGFGRIVDQARDVEVVDQLGIAEAQRQIADRGDIDHE